MSVAATAGVEPATPAQRAKIVGDACVVCQQTKALTAMRLALADGCDDVDCVVPMC